ncbi:MAG: hypothetical protein E4G94_02795 [ANME-2 cluster archaeon]|nr:MAG: hypothetical protein E4G94_02795 [ANME-2 cluster archaeon]
MDDTKNQIGRTPNKFRQVLFIEGKPAPLYVNIPRTKVNVTIDGVTHKLGYMSGVLIGLLRKIPGAKVETTTIDSTKTVGLRTVRGLHIRKSKENTTIEVSAPTEEALAEKIAAVTAELESSDTNVTQRCSWVCVTDKAHPELDPVVDDKEDETIVLTPKKKTEPGRHGPGRRVATKTDNTVAMKKRMLRLKELAEKKGLTGVSLNSPPTDVEMHGE